MNVKYVKYVTNVLSYTCKQEYGTYFLFTWGGGKHSGDNPPPPSQNKTHTLLRKLMLNNYVSTKVLSYTCNQEYEINSFFGRRGDGAFRGLG